MEQMNRLTSRCSKLKSSAARLRPVRRPSIAHPLDPIPWSRPASVRSRYRSPP